MALPLQFVRPDRLNEQYWGLVPSRCERGTALRVLKGKVMTKVTGLGRRRHLPWTAMRNYPPSLLFLIAWLSAFTAICPSVSAASPDSGWTVVNLHHPRGKSIARQCVWSADHKSLALCYTDGGVGFVDPLTKNQKFVPGALGRDSEGRITWRPDGSLTFFGDAATKVVNPKTGKVTTLKALSFGSSTNISPDYKLALTRGYGYEPLEVVDLASGKRISSSGPQGMMQKGTYSTQIEHWSPDSTMFVATRGHLLNLFEPKSNEPISSYACPANLFFDYAEWLPNGKLFLFGFQNSDRVMLKFEVSGGRLLFKERAVVPSGLPKVAGPSSLSRGSREMVVIEPDGKTLTVATHDVNSEKLSFWSSATNRRIFAADDHEPSFNATPYISPDGRYLALAHFNSGIITLFDTRTGKQLWKVEQKGEGDQANVDVNWSPDSRAVAIVGDAGSLQICYLKKVASQR